MSFRTRRPRAQHLLKPRKFKPGIDIFDPVEAGLEWFESLNKHGIAIRYRKTCGSWNYALEQSVIRIWKINIFWVAHWFWIVLTFQRFRVICPQKRRSKNSTAGALRRRHVWTGGPHFEPIKLAKRKSWQFIPVLTHNCGHNLASGKPFQAAE